MVLCSIDAPEPQAVEAEQSGTVADQPFSTAHQAVDMSFTFARTFWFLGPAAMLETINPDNTCSKLMRKMDATFGATSQHMAHGSLDVLASTRSVLDTTGTAATPAAVDHMVSDQALARRLQMEEDIVAAPHRAASPAAQITGTGSENTSNNSTAAKSGSAAVIVPAHTGVITPTRQPASIAPDAPIVTASETAVLIPLNTQANGQPLYPLLHPALPRANHMASDEALARHLQEHEHTYTSEVIRALPPVPPRQPQ